MTDGGSGGEAPRTYENGRRFRGGLERPESSKNCFAEQNFLALHGKIRFSKGFPNINFVFQKPSCGFRRAPGRRRNKNKIKTQIQRLRQQIRLAAHLPSCDGAEKAALGTAGHRIEVQGLRPCTPLDR